MITVITEATVEPITVTEAKDWLGIQTTTHDTKLTAAIKAARKKVEQLSGRSMVVRTIKLTVQEWDGTILELPYPVVSSIVSLKSMDTAGVETTHNVSDYALVYNRLHFSGFGNSIEVTYTTAANAEEFYKLAIKKQLAYDYRNEYTENGFDQEVIKMISSVTLNLGY